MKLRCLCLLLLTLGSLRAAPLTATTAVMARPDAAASVVGYLKAGSEPDVAGPAPDGWLAVRLPGPFTAYVPSSSLTKSLDVKSGASIYSAPRADAGVLATAERGDKISITGVMGRWTRVSLDQGIVGYIASGAQKVDVVAQPLQDVPAGQTAANAGPSAPPATGPGHPVDSSAGLSGPQYFEGRFASSHRWIGPSRPFDWQLNDANGTRLAYLDVNKLLQTGKMEKYIGHTVGVFGTITQIPKSRDVVVTVESLQLR